VEEVIMFTRLHPTFVFAALVWAAPAMAQSIRPAPSVEFLAGHAGFADEAVIEDAVVGGAARFYLTPRISVGPEITYMTGPNTDRDWYFLGNLTWDVRQPQAGRPPRVSPFLIIGGGFFTHSDDFPSGTFTSSEGAFAGGGGARIHINDRVYAMGDFRIGWELHYRITGGIGVGVRSKERVSPSAHVGRS
jgi:hypothetical protein